MSDDSRGKSVTTATAGRPIRAYLLSEGARERQRTEAERTRRLSRTSSCLLKKRKSAQRCCCCVSDLAKKGHACSFLSFLSLLSFFSSLRPSHYYSVDALLGTRAKLCIIYAWPSSIFEKQPRPPPLCF